MKPKHLIFSAGVIITMILAVSCECVPNLETKKVVEPSDAANVMFVNALPEYRSVDIEGKIAKYPNISYDNAEYKYNLMLHGTNTVRFLNSDDGSVLFNVFVELHKDFYYTFIGYGTGSPDRQKTLLVRDSIEHFTADFAYIRFINVWSNKENDIETPPAGFEFSGETTFADTLNTGAAGGFYEIQPGKIFNLMIRDSKTGENITMLDGIEARAGFIYNFILRGYAGSPNGSGTELLTARVAIP